MAASLKLLGRTAGGDAGASQEAFKGHSKPTRASQSRSRRYSSC